MTPPPAPTLNVIFNSPNNLTYTQLDLPVHMVLNGSIRIVNTALSCDDPVLVAAQVAVATYDGLNETLSVWCGNSTAVSTCKVSICVCDVRACVSVCVCLCVCACDLSVSLCVHVICVCVFTHLAFINYLQCFHCIVLHAYLPGTCLYRWLLSHLRMIIKHDNKYMCTVHYCALNMHVHFHYGVIITNHKSTATYHVIVHKLLITTSSFLS